MSGNDTTRSPASSPEALRAEVERSRNQLGETVELLAAKADLKGQAQEKSAEFRAQMQQKASGAAHAVQQKATHVAQLVHQKAPEVGKIAQTKTPERALKAGTLVVGIGRRHPGRAVALGGILALLGFFVLRRRARR